MKFSLAVVFASIGAFGVFIPVASATSPLTVSVVSETVSGTSASFDVVVTNDSGLPIDINDTVAHVFQDSVNPDIVFGTPIQTTLPAPIHASGFFNHNGVVANTASDVSDNYGGGVTNTLAPGQTAGLMRVPFTVLNNYVGTIQIDISTDAFNGTQFLTPDQLNTIDFTPQSGFITIAAVTPEPTSLALLGLGLPVLLKRRQRSA